MRKRWWRIGMAPRKGKRTELARWLEEHGPAQIGETEFEELRRALVPVSESYLRKLVRESGVPLAPLVEGVRQGSFDELEASLLKFLDEYERGDPARRAAVRRVVITAKDHARLAARNLDKRAEKEEMLLWLLTWLENPPLFRDWVRLRRSFADATLCPPSPLE
jgi:hypothetical protein